jgi:ricin-type beta-trefoil lectin protein
MNAKHLRRAAAAVGITALTAGGMVGLGAGAAAASTVAGTTAYWISPAYDSQEIAVAGGDTSVGGRLIQWYNDGGDEQKWYFDSVYNSSGYLVGYLLRNKNSGMCMDTDGIAGDELFQTYCNEDDTGQIFTSKLNDSYFHVVTYTYINVETGLALDVSGFSYGEGANIDLWYPNGVGNQDFNVAATS